MGTVPALLGGDFTAHEHKGRVAADADTASLALALVGAAHQLLLTRGLYAPDLRERCARWSRR
ncbi:hypothetical protein [Nonomuraea sp. NPDC048901]|uniref:hypothetical protein n=1 Tax=unclassified Nonomuraea TaxID=2593643 RepID=UPI00340D07A2